MARKSRETRGGRLGRSETVTVRLDPRLNYLCELAARVQRRTKSSFIEAMLDEKVHATELDPRSGNATIGGYADRLWHVDEPQRVIELAALAPHLMTISEQEIWAVICKCGYFWKGNWVAEEDEEIWTWKCEPGTLIGERVSANWPAIVALAGGDKTATLPDYRRRRSVDIPF